MRTAHALAPAKVNLWLDVKGRRDDGFHELDTGMLALDLFDELEVRETASGRVELEVGGPAATPDIPSGATNLAVRAAELQLRHAVTTGAASAESGLAIRLVKNVPSGAGLGGGSSDAAAALVGAAAALGVEVDHDLARGWLASLGSDCVFFLDAAVTGFARCIGRGELVEAREIGDESWTFALFAPDLPVPTKAVYGALGTALSEGGAMPSVRESLLSCPESELRLGLRNHLEAAALEAVPALRPWRQLLDANNASHFLLSGSGSTFFGVYSDGTEARRALDDLVGAAKALDLAVRGHWLLRPAGRGAVVASVSRGE